jgi:hypothetical protein
MATNHRLISLAVLLVLFASSGSAFAHPTEPQATFQLKKGWVEVAIRKDGKPLESATFEIMDEKGAKFGAGEIDAEGQTAFPLPHGASFIVEIKTGDRTADPIRLFKTDVGVEPARVLLSYGLRPCCRSIKSRGDMPSVEDETQTPAPTEKPTPWLMLASVFAGVSIIVVTLLFVVLRRYNSDPAFASRK